MTQPHVNVIVCRPYDEAERIYADEFKAVPINGDCGHRLWAGPSTLVAMRNDPRILAYCFGCTHRFGQPPDRVTALPGALEELARVEGVGYADQVAAELRDWRPHG